MTLQIVDASSVPFDPQAILRTLVEHGVDFVVIGGIACLAHGYDRGTGDVDTTLSAEEENLTCLVNALGALGARLLVPLNTTQEATVEASVDEATFRSMTSVRFLTVHGVLDVVLRPDGVPTYEDWAATALPVALPDGTTVRIGALDLIIRSKEAAGRPKDQEAVPRLQALLRLIEERGR